MQNLRRQQITDFWWVEVHLASAKCKGNYPCPLPSAQHRLLRFSANLLVDTNLETIIFIGWRGV